MTPTLSAVQIYDLHHQLPLPLLVPYVLQAGEPTAGHQAATPVQKSQIALFLRREVS
jgi:hypothetical protein